MAPQYQHRSPPRAAHRSRGGSPVARPAGPVVDAEEVLPSAAPVAGNATEDAPAAVGTAMGKVAVITGASTGIGLSTVEGLARSGQYGTIVLAGRDAEKHARAIEGLRERLDPSSAPLELRHMSLDLDSLQSVRNFAEDFLALGLPLHTLILNAGVMAVPKRKTTVDGFEYQFGVNHLSHFLLANLLLDALVAAASPTEPGRVVSLSSTAHQMPSPLLRGSLEDLQSSEGYSPWGAYGQSKLSNMLFAYELDRRCRERGLPIAANAVHPGVVDTELWRYLPGGGKAPQLLQDLARPFLSLSMKTAEDGARTSVLLATMPDGKLSGRYWQDERPAASMDVDPVRELPFKLGALLPVRPRLTSYDPTTWAELWRRSEELVGLRPGDVAAWGDAPAPAATAAA